MGEVCKKTVQSFDPLDKNQTIHNKIFLTASAGTGKTFAIEHVVCRLIVEGVTIDKILITTFTRAGARDLTRRIHANLLSSLNDPPDYLKFLGNDPFIAIKNAITAIDNVQIYTIHSFCHKMLSEFAFEAKISSPRYDSESDKFANNDIELAILDTLRSTLNDNEFSQAQLSRMITQFNRDLSKYVKKMTTLLETDPIISGLEPYNSLYDKFIDLTDKSMKDYLIDIAPLYKGMTNNKKNIHPLILEQIDAIENRNLDELILSKPSIFDLLTTDNLKKNVNLPMTNFPINEIANIVKKASNPISIFLRMAKKVQAKLLDKDVKNSNKLITMMAEKIDSPKFKDVVKNKYEACIIDEFQDTDKLQWKIFYNLFFDSTRLFFIVGDPKQSIYLFRNADLPTFISAKDKFPNIYSLPTNYRSNKNIITSLNSLFDETFTPSLFTFKQNDSSIIYQQVCSGRGNEENGDSVKFLFFEGEKGRSKTWPTVDMENEKIFPYIVNEIKKLPSTKSIAILVKDRYQSTRLCDFLNKKNILSISSSSVSVLETEVFNLIELALQLAISPRDVSLLKQFLHHPIIGWPIQKLQCDMLDKDLQACVVSFVKLRENLKNNSIASFLNALCQTSFTNRPLLQQIALSHESYSDLMQLIPIIIDYNNITPMQCLDKLKLLDQENHPYLKRKILVEGDVVQVMTSHMSKGLEFDVVFALGISSHSGDSPEILKVDEKCVVFENKNPSHTTAIFELDKEKMRLLYVSLTRSKERLYIIAPINKEPKQQPFGSASPLELLLARIDKKFLSYEETYKEIPLINVKTLTESLSKIQISTQLIDVVQFSSAQQVAPPPHLTAPTELNKVRLPKPSLSFSSLPKIHLPATLPPNDFIIPQGSETGIIFHAIFEKLIEDGLYFSWNDKKINHLIQHEIELTHLQNWQKEIFDIIRVAFHTPLNIFSLKDVPPHQMNSEIPFLYQLKTHTMKGFIDLVFHMEGKYYILDWKLTRLENYTQPELKKAMEVNNYFTQISIYKEALKLYLQTIQRQPFEELFGGAFYFFLRGKENGLFAI